METETTGRRFIFARVRQLLLPLLLLTLSAACAQSPDETEGPFDPTWESLRQQTFPKWLHDAKFGIWTHWGAFAVPAYRHEWYARKIFTKPDFRRYHENTYGPLEKIGYHDLIPKFTAKEFDPDRWAKLFEQAGARFAGPLAEHHDGFAMYDSDQTRWDASEKGPKRDVHAELARAIRERNMKFVTSFHHLRKWWFYEPSYTSDDRFQTRDPVYAGLDGLYPPPHEKGERAPESYFRMSMAKVREVVDQYQPSLLFFDSGPYSRMHDEGNWFRKRDYEPHFLKAIAHYYNQGEKWGKEVAIIAEEEDLPGELTSEVGVETLERGKMDTIQDQPWMMITSVDDIAWGYIQKPDYKSSLQLLRLFVDVVSKNGVFWLNIGPKADGTIPDPQKERLLDIGTWLERNGAAIYGTRPWRTAGSGPVRFTRNEHALFAITFSKPHERWTTDVLTKSEAEAVQSAGLLGSDKPLDVSFSDGVLSVEMPEGAVDQLAYVFRLQMKDGAW